MNQKSAREIAEEISRFNDIECGNQKALIRNIAKAIQAERQRCEGLREALRDCQEYFKDRADADSQGDPSRFVPNDEMQMLMLVDSALSSTTSAAESGEEFVCPCELHNDCDSECDPRECHKPSVESECGSTCCYDADCTCKKVCIDGEQACEKHEQEEGAHYGPLKKKPVVSKTAVEAEKPNVCYCDVKPTRPQCPVHEKPKEPSLAKFNPPVALTERDLEMVKTESLLVRMANELIEIKKFYAHMGWNPSVTTDELLAEYEQTKEKP